MKTLIQFLTEAIKTSKDFVAYLKKNDGMAPMDGGELNYFCKILNDENFNLDESPQFRDQLKKEGMYNNYYATGMTRTKPGEKISIETLPIYGRRDRYETKWFGPNPQTLVDKDLRDRTWALKRRIEFFIEQ